MTLLYVALGIVFGLALSRSGAADYNFIQGMFLLTNLQLYGIIGSAVVITAPLLYLLKRYGRTVTGTPITIELKGLNRGTIAGGAMFGVGWSITGMCPGPILVNIGEGKLYALAALAGALLGATLLSAGYTKLAGPFGLPPLRVPVEV
ncbi:MAG: transporter [Dehalococcoidia bacterium]|nr:transporter [Dehalococcoidia bacterium]